MTWPEIAKAIKPIKTLNAECTAEWLHGLLSTLPKHYLDCEIGTYYGYISAMMALSGFRTICIDNMRIPMPMMSLDTLVLLKLMNPTIGLLYLDGDHNYHNVIKELQEFDRFIPHGGIVCGDDCTLLENFAVFNPAFTFNGCWSQGLADQFRYDKHDYGAGVSTAVWEYFSGNNRYEPLQGVPGNQFGFRKIG